MVPALTLLFAYVRLMAADYYLALQLAMTSFIVSFAILFVYMGMLISRESKQQ